jgi:hypothetical protein
MDVDDEVAALERELQACDVRLGLMPPADAGNRNDTLRRELEHRRADVLRRLEEIGAISRLEREVGSSTAN